MDENQKERNLNKNKNKNKNLVTEIKNDGRSVFDFSTPEELQVSTLKSTLGFIIYFFVFVVCVPLILLKFKNYTLLEVYMPNVDLLANLLSYRGGPFGDNLFIDLYSPNSTNISAFIQTTLINYIALLGVTYIISRETKLSKKISYGWGIGFVMLLLTYLLPAQFIVKLMNYVYNKITPYFEKHYFIFPAYFPSILVGALMTVGIIYLEKNIIFFYRKNLTKFADFLLAIPRKL